MISKRKKADGHRNRKRSRVRVGIQVAVACIVIVGLVFHLDWGTYSSMGIGYIAAICPLGALEAACGAWAFMPRLLIAFLVVCIVVLLVGRAFCSWVCPVPLLSRFFETKRRRQLEENERSEAATCAWERYSANQQVYESGLAACEDLGVSQHVPAKQKFDSRFAVLLGALGGAAVFGFPVFCMACPVGLTCATVVALVRLIGFNEPTWGLLVFPLVVVLELTLLRKWCSKLCPISALMSFVARANRTFKPVVDASLCLRDTKGEPCRACAGACPEHIDPHSNLGLVSVNECVRCAQCADACPTQAIAFSFLPPVRAAVVVAGSSGKEPDKADLGGESLDGEAKDLS